MSFRMRKKETLPVIDNYTQILAQDRSQPIETIGKYRYTIKTKNTYKPKELITRNPEYYLGTDEPVYESETIVYDKEEEKWKIVKRNKE